MDFSKLQIPEDAVPDDGYRCRKCLQSFHRPGGARDPTERLIPQHALALLARTAYANSALDGMQRLAYA